MRGLRCQGPTGLPPACGPALPRSPWPLVLSPAEGSTFLAVVGVSPGLGPLRPLCLSPCRSTQHGSVGPGSPSPPMDLPWSTGAAFARQWHPGAQTVPLSPRFGPGGDK